MEGDTCHAKTRSTCKRSGSDAVARAELEFRMNLLSYRIEALWGFCAIIKHCSNLRFPGNNRVLSRLLKASLKTRDKALNLREVVVVPRYSFLLHSALTGKG